jgi:ABC-type dipeptide/oligopeptide/nickel transport system permease subunit
VTAGALSQQPEQAEPGSDNSSSNRLTGVYAGLRTFARGDPAALVGAVLLATVVVCAVLAPVIAPHGPLAQDQFHVGVGSSGSHLLGTDQLGRDIFSRLVYGARSSLLIGAGSVLLALVVGTVFGTLAGYYGGRVDAVISAAIDLVLAFPLLILAILVVVVLGPNLWNVIFAISVSQFPLFVRVARSLALSLRQREFVEASISLGSSDLKVMRKHVLPNVLPLMMVQATTTVGLAILSGAALSFLGIGLQPPTPDWGRMVSELGVFVFTRPELPFYPGAAIAITVVAANLLGDGLVKIADPLGRRVL